MIRAYDVLDFSSHMDNRRKEAFNMAKVALEQESILDKIRAEIEQRRQRYEVAMYYIDAAREQELSWVLEVIDKYKAEN